MIRTRLVPFLVSQFRAAGRRLRVAVSGCIDGIASRLLRPPCHAFAPPRQRETLQPETALAAFVAAVACTAAALAFGGGDFEIVSFTIDSGGGTSAGGGFEVAGTVGQPDAGTMSGGDYTLAGGFWPGGTTTAPCPADTDNNGAVDVDDLVNVILDWSTNGSGHGGDVDGSGVVDVDDLVEVILGWGVCP